MQVSFYAGFLLFYFSIPWLSVWSCLKTHLFYIFYPSPMSAHWLEIMLLWTLIILVAFLFTVVTEVPAAVHVPAATDVTEQPVGATSETSVRPVVTTRPTDVVYSMLKLDVTIDSIQLQLFTGDSDLVSWYKCYVKYLVYKSTKVPFFLHINPISLVETVSTKGDF